MKPIYQDILLLEMNYGQYLVGNEQYAMENMQIIKILIQLTNQLINSISFLITEKYSKICKTKHY
jgi:hypothetical protein